MPQVFNRLHEARPKAGLRRMFLHHDNATAHTAARTLDFLVENDIQLLPHPPYSPDLAPCDFFLFPELKKQLRGWHFETENAAILLMNEVLEVIPKDGFQDCFEKWFTRMKHCIDVGGHYFEKL